jgi:hypothetical protein
LFVLFVCFLFVCLLVFLCLFVCLFVLAQQHAVFRGLLINEDSRSHTMTHHIQ